MRLLKASSITEPEGLELVSFVADFAPPYAILSHTWGRDEVLYEDVLNRTSSQRAAYQKCYYACEQTLADGLEYLWIDTCCIDKSSSAELSEAINSMFEWYRGSAVCYAYLEDYMAEKGACGDLSDSRWFTRGWTLQELLAPTRLVFYAAGWNKVGTRDELSSDIFHFTNISIDILIGRRPVETTSIANRMGWAAHRETTRPEDMAYCLMGMFDVHMPLLYGEGQRKAFFRLQEEIMKDSSDHTLFAWADADAHDETECGMLAPSPRCFASTEMLLPYEEWSDRVPHSWTSKGLLIELRLTPVHHAGISNMYQATLNCPPPDFEEASYLAVYLKCTNKHLRRYSRVCASRLGRVRDSDAVVGLGGTEGPRHALEQIFVKESNQKMRFETEMVYPYHFLVLETSFDKGKSYKITQMARYSKREIAGPYSTGTYGNRAMLIRRGPGLVTTALVISRKDGKKLLVAFGVAEPLRLAFDAYELDDKASMPPPDVVQEAFTPQDLREVVELRHHRVSVDLLGTEIDSSQGRSKTYKVKLCVEEFEAPPSFDEVMSMDQKAGLGLEPQGSGRSGDKGKGKGKLKNLFGSSSKQG